MQRALVVSVVLALAAGAGASLLLLASGRGLLAAMGADELMLPPALTYLRFRAPAVPAALILVVVQAAYRAVLDLRTPCLVVIAAGVLNVVLDPILIFHMRLGVAGASLATTISQFFGVAVFAVLIARSHVFGLRAPQPKTLSAARMRWGSFPAARNALLSSSVLR
eukprot:SM004012S15255  [mRNA]  locus=s4012:405:1285:+ [translate_table: standard]